MFPIDITFLIFLHAFGMVIGIIPPYLWGKNGGDEGIIINQQYLKGFLKLIHHWHIGVAMIVMTFVTYLFIYPSPLQPFFLGWGLTTFLDDALFHSFENYFQRIIEHK